MADRSTDSGENGSTADSELADSSLFRLSKLIRQGEISSKRLVEIYLDRIRRFDGREGLNAYITVASDAAVRQAEALDRLTQKRQFKGPLHGLPVAVKDNLETKEMRTTGGSKILESWEPPRDAHVIERLKEAGAVVLGKTNMHEFAYGITTNNPHYGPTRNPYDPSRIPGGSSGGSAAAAAAGLCASAIGTDTGGSVRVPAALCGVVGLKPTLGRVGRGGMMYLSFSRDVIGPITRTVIDSALLLQAIAGKDPRDPESSSRPVQDYVLNLREDLKGKTFGVPRRYFLDDIHPDTQTVFDDAVKEIESLGGRVKEVEVKHMDTAHQTGFNIVLAECVYHLEAYLRTFDPQATIEKYLDQLGPDVRKALIGQKGTPESRPIPGHIYVKAVREDRNRMISKFEEAMAGVDALILPTTPLPATKIEEGDETELLGKKIDTFRVFIKNCDPVSVVGYPAITLPAGYSSAGLPIGLQMVARPWEEESLLSIAHAFEQATEVRKAPKLP